MQLDPVVHLQPQTRAGRSWAAKLGLADNQMPSPNRSQAQSTTQCCNSHCSMAQLQAAAPKGDAAGTLRSATLRRAGNLGLDSHCATYRHIPQGPIVTCRAGPGGNSAMHGCLHAQEQRSTSGLQRSSTSHGSETMLLYPPMDSAFHQACRRGREDMKRFRGREIRFHGSICRHKQAATALGACI